jgi:hypothetical protein
MSNTTPPPTKPEDTGFISSLAKAVRESDGNFLKAAGGVAGAVGTQLVRALEPLTVPYRELVSRPLSTAFLASNADYRGDINGGLFDVNTWKKAYNTSRTVSPGQSIVGFVGGSLVAGDQGTDKIDWSNSQEVNTYFSRGPQKYISFASDFATSLFLDPLVVVGRGASLTRRAILTRPVTTKRMPALLKEVDDGVAGVDNAFRRKIDFYKANAEDLSAIAADPMIASSQIGEGAAEIMQEAARLAIQTGDDSFIGNFIKVGIGNEPSRDALRIQSEALANRVDSLQGRKSNVDSYLRAKKTVEDVDSTEFLLPYNLATDARQRSFKLKEQEVLGKELAEATKQSDFVSKLISSDDSVQGIFKDVTWSPYAAIEAQRIKNNLTFNSAFWGEIDNGKGVRVLRWFNPSQALREKSSGVARLGAVVGDRSIIEARARTRDLGKLGELSGAAQREIFNTFPARGNKAEKGKWFDGLQEKTVAAIVKKHVGATDPDEIKLIEDLGIAFARKSNDYKRQTLYRILDDPNYTISDEFGNESTIELMKDYVDDLAKEISAKAGKNKVDENDVVNARRMAKDLMSDVPTMTSQVPNLHIAMDMDIFNDVIREQSNLIKLLIDDVRLNPDDYAGKSPSQVISDILDNKIVELTASETSGQVARDRIIRTRNLAEQLTDNLYSLVWKPTTLMSFKYTSRNVTEGWQRVFASGIEFARDSDLSVREVLSGGFEKGVISRAKSRMKQDANAKAASIVFNEEYPALSKEAKVLYREIDGALSASSDSLSSNILQVVNNSKLTFDNYGRMSQEVSNEATREALRQMDAVPYRLSDDIDVVSELDKDGTIAKELYDSILTGDIKNAKNIIVSTTEGPVFDTLRVMQERVREQYDTLDAIRLRKDYTTDVPPKLREYIESTLDSFRGIDDSIQTVVHTTLTRALARGRMDELIVNGTVNREIIAAGTEQFEVVPGLFLDGFRQGPIGQIMAKEASAAQNNMRTIFDAQRIADSRYVNGQVHERTITPDNKIWAPAAADFANHHMNDYVAQKFIETDDLAKVVAWAKSSDPKAVAWRETKKFDSGRYSTAGVQDAIERLVTEIKFTVDNILPKVGIDGRLVDETTDAAGQPISALRIKAMEGRLTAEDMLKIPEAQRASVRGNELTADGPNGFRNKWSAIVTKIFDVIGTKPEDALVRHPFYNMMYKAEGKRRSKLLLEQGYTTDQIAKMSGEIQIQSHKFAYKMLMERLYSIERYTDPGHLLRFVSPFYMAKQNSNRYWFGYALRNPQAAARYFMIYQSPGKVFSVEDENGQEIKTVNPFNAQDATIKVTIPGAVAKFFGKDIPEGVSFNTPISSFDLINNGYIPFVPEAGGPLVDVGAGTILNALSGKAYDPELFLTKMGVDPEFLRNKLFPYYKSQQDMSTGEVLLSIAISPNSWMRSLAASDVPIISDAFGLIDPNASDRYNRRVIVAYNDIFAKWDSERDPYKPEALTDEKRAEMLSQAMGAATQMNFAEAMFSAFGYVAAPKFSTQQEELRKDLRVMKQDAVNNGLSEDHGLLEFINQYGFERASVAQFTPREQNPYGFMSTPQTLNNLNKYSDAFSNAYGEVGETKVAGAMLNAGDPVKDYSAVANSKLYSSNVTGIGAVKAKLTDRNEAARELEIGQGYKMQFAAKDYFDAQVASGELSEKDAKQRYKDAKAVIAQRYPAWLADSGTMNTQKANNNVKAIFRFLGNEKYVNGVVKNNDLQKAVYFYMEARKNLVVRRLQVDSNPNASIDSDKFSDVQYLQKQLVTDLTKQVPEFGKFFTYYLENDPLSYDSEIVSID